jgi:hypothetical protein
VLRGTMPSPPPPTRKRVTFLSGVGHRRRRPGRWSSSGPASARRRPGRRPSCGSCPPHRRRQRGRLGRERGDHVTAFTDQEQFQTRIGRPPRPIHRISIELRGIGRRRSVNNRRSAADARRLERYRRAKGASMSSALLMVYGANGYVGKHVARTAGRLGVKAIVAGRNAAKLDRIASETRPRAARLRSRRIPPPSTALCIESPWC